MTDQPMTNEPTDQPILDLPPTDHTPAFSPAREPLQDPVVTPPAEPKIDTAADDADDFNSDDYEYVRVGGKVRAIRKSSVSDEPETATQAVPKAATAEVVDPHFYVWLANGKVIRVKQSDLPTSAGTNATYGHWQEDDKVYVIVNVVPVETIVKGEGK